MALGAYRVPRGLTEIEKLNTAVELQPDFKSWVQECKSAMEDEGFGTISLAGGESPSGISYKQAERDSMAGNDVYMSHASLFCRGLAWEFYFLGEAGRGTGNKPLEWLDENVESFGLSVEYVTDGNGTVKSRFFKPLEIEVDQHTTEVVYEGDVDRGGYASDSSGAAGSYSGTGSVSSVAYFFSNQFTSIQTAMESELLKGERALANDTPVFNAIKEAVGASMRSFSSTPSGKFVAWYPDYWGVAGNTPCMTISDMELVNLKITQSDKSFYSHVYCTGVNTSGTSLAVYQSQGVVSIESNLNALASEAELNETGISEVSDEVSYILKKILYIPEGEEWKYTPKELYRRYGARPTNASTNGAKLIEAVGEEDSANPTYIMPFLYALYRFMELWADQNKVDIDITFNPSIIPGCRIKLQSLDVSFYVKSVSHNMSYRSGFSTSISAVCPTGTLVSGMVNV